VGRVIDIGRQIANAEREFSHGNAPEGFRMLAQVCAFMLGRIDALEAELELRADKAEASA
jgi:hypothetical protein